MLAELRIADAYFQQGLYEEALEAFRRFGDEQAAHNNLGYVYFLNRDVERAIEQYEAALRYEGVGRLQVLRNLRAAIGIADGDL